MVRVFSATVMLVVTFAAAGAPRLKEKSGDNLLVGRWQLTTKLHEGEDVTATDPDVVFVFAANGNSAIIRNGEAVQATNRYTTDNTVNPPSITLSKYEKQEVLQVQAIFKVNGDNLMLAVDLVDNKRKLLDFNVNNRHTSTYFFKRVKND